MATPEGSRISPRRPRERRLEASPFPHQRIVTVSFSRSDVAFLKNLFVVSTKFLTDDDFVVEVTESDAAVRPDVSINFPSGTELVKLSLRGTSSFSVFCQSVNVENLNGELEPTVVLQFMINSTYSRSRPISLITDFVDFSIAKIITEMRGADFIVFRIS